MQNCANYGQHLLPQAGGSGRRDRLRFWCHRGLWLRPGSGSGQETGDGRREPTQATSKTSLLLEMAFNYSLVVQEVDHVGGRHCRRRRRRRRLRMKVD